MRRLALLLVSLLLLAAPPATATANDELRIEPAGREARTLTISGLGEPDVRERAYTLPGASASTPITGYSLDRVLAAANVDPYRFGSLEIQGPSGTVRVSRDEATGRTTFPEGPPVFYSENGEGRFLLPVSDTGAPAQLATGGPMTIRIAPGGGPRVSISTSKRKVSVGEPVRFTARVRGVEPDENLSISWDFGDDRVAAGREVTHRFRTPGPHDVVVVVTTSGDDPGADDAVSVQVGKVPPGPDRKGGGTNPDSSAPDSGAGTGTGSTPATPGSSVAPSSPSSGAGTSAAPPPPTPTPQPKSRRKPPGDSVRESDGSEQVEGIELADLNALAGQAGRDAVEAARRGREREEDEPDGGASGVWWALSIAGLLGLGGLLELGRLPGRRTV